MKHLFKGFSISILLILYACSQDEEDYVTTTPVVVDLNQVPYQTLSEYNFFEGDLSAQKPSYGVLSFEPASALFTDYALKKRFVWMPENTMGTYQTADTIIKFPVGAVLIKTFYYNNVQPQNNIKVLETRLLIHKSEGWIVANYIWNEDQTEAYLNLEGKDVDISWTDETGTQRQTTYHIPDEQECFACHRSYYLNKEFPIGVKPQNLNFNYTYADGQLNQLQKWIDMGYLNDKPSAINAVANYQDTAQPLDLRARSYIDINCAHCHKDGGYAQNYVMRFAYSKTDNPDNLGACIEPSHYMPDFMGDYIVTLGNHEHSMLYARMNTNDFYFRMPTFGRTLIHEEGVALIRQWIDAMEGSCD